MSVVLLAVIIVVITLILLAALKSQGARGSIGYPYQPAKTLFSPAERSFLGVLDQAIGEEYRVFGKVRVADVATVKPGLGKSARQGALNRIAAKHFDFILCRASDLSVVCAVELNDKSHSNKRTQARDDLLTKVCESIGLPLLVFPAKQAYSVAEVRARLSDGVATATGMPIALEAKQ